MAEYDLLIRGGTIVDGTGIPRYRADIAVKNGRVARISGRIPAGGAREIDAAGCIVAPGAIDLHTHYDAQLNWDPYASLSGWFGVTSLTIGECGFGFAPTRAEDRELNMRMMDRIEAIPLESMRKGLRWDWETFPEYLDSLDSQGLGLRGSLRVGNWADIIVYDLDALGFLYDRAVFDTDSPGGERRLVQKPTGLRYTIVNGEVTFEDNVCTGALPGKLLRSYDMVG